MKLPPGLRLRDGVYYFERRGTPLGRISKSLNTEDFTVAVQRYAAVKRIMDEARWDVVEWWRSDRVDLAEVVDAHHEGRLDQLRVGSKSGPICLGHESEAWLSSLSGVLEDSSVTRYRITMNSLCERFGHDREMRTLTKRELTDWLMLPRERLTRRRGEVSPWRPATRAFVIRVCKSFWSHTIQHESEVAEIQGTRPRITRNPWDGVRVGEDKGARKEFLPREQWPDLLASVEGTPWAALLGLAFLAGLRQSEIGHLRREDIDLGPFPTVKVQPRVKPVAWKPKRKRSIREVPLGPTLVDILRRHVASGFAGEVYLFGDKPLASHTALSWARQAMEEAGITYGADVDGGLTLHSGRHSFASWLVQDGVSLLVVSELLGNTVGVCETHYAHLTPDTKRLAVARLEMAPGAITNAISRKQAGA